MSLQCGQPFSYITVNDTGKARCTYVGEDNAYKISVAKPEGKRPLASPRPRLEDNTKTVLKQIECDGLNWTHMTWDRHKWQALVNTQ